MRAQWFFDLNHRGQYDTPAYLRKQYERKFDRLNSQSPNRIPLTRLEQSELAERQCETEHSHSDEAHKG